MKRILLVTIAVAALVVGALVAFVYVRARTKPVLDDAARENAPGLFVEVNDGIVHYETAGDSAAPAVVFIHGSSAPYVVWDRNFHAIADAGYRTLRYDLFGRGFSDRPRVEYDRGLYVRQLAELIEACGLRTPVHVVGLSMGGALAVSFADSLPDRVASLILVSPAGPYLASVAARNQVGRLVDRLKALVNPSSEHEKRREAVEPLVPAIRQQLKYRGVEWATYSFLKNRNAERLERSFVNVGGHPRPGLLIWGTDDTVLSFAFADSVKKYLVNFELHPIPGAGHASQFERPDTVNTLMLAFLRRAAGVQTGETVGAVKEPEGGPGR